MSGSTTHYVAKTIFTASELCYIAGTFSYGLLVIGKEGYSPQYEGATGYIKIYDSNGILKSTAVNMTGGFGSGSFTALLSEGDYMEIYVYGYKGETDTSVSSSASLSVNGTVISIEIE